MRAMAVLLHLCCVTSGPFAQQAEVTRYDVDQGLPQSMVNHVVQDADGFIWLGTGDGLARFDGQRFVAYKHDPRDTTSLSQNAIWGLAEADAHHLWVGTRHGLDRLDRRTGRFGHVRTGPGLDGCWRPVRITSQEAVFYSPWNRDLLLITGDRATRVPTGQIESYCMRLVGDDLHLYLNSDSLVVISLEGRKERVLTSPISAGKKPSAIIDIGKDWLVLSERDGWLLHPDGSYAGLPAPLQHRLRAVSGPKHVARDAQGRLWVGISGVGVLLLRDDLSIERTYPLLDKGEGPLVITTIAFDRQGNTWVGTDGKGVFKIAPQRIKFGRCMPGMGLPWEPSSWFVRAFAQWDEHRVLVGFHLGGFALFDERTATLAPIELTGMDADAGCNRMFNDPSGTIWMKCGSDVFTVSPGPDAALERRSSGRPTALLQDHDGQALLLTDSLVTRFERSNGAWHRTTSRSALPDSVLGIAERIAVDRLGQWWASAAVLPISAWHRGARLPIAGEAPVPGTRMLRFVPTDAGDAWMTTTDGLYHWSLTDRRVLDHFTIHDGLPDQFLYMMLPGEQDSWWISTNNGLTLYDPRSARFRNYGTTHGLQSREFNSGAALLSRGGWLYFGGVNGFNFFRAGDVRDDPDTALVRVVGAHMGDAPVAYDREIELPYGRNELRVDLAVLEFTAPGDARYAYQLEGYDTTWHVRSAARAIELINLPDGEFRMMVKGINADGLTSRAVELMRIRVPLPFWASGWAVALGSVGLAALVSALIFLVYRRRMQRRLELAEQEMKELRLRTRLAKDMHDDVGSGLARMAALSRSSKRETDAAERFDKLAGISAELLDNLRDVVWMNDPRHDTLDALLLRIREHAHDLFEESGANVVADYPDPLPAQQVDGAFRRNLFLIAKEALQNARKYSQAHGIVIRWLQDGDDFSLKIIDDGRGISSDVPQGGGHGSANMRQRAVEIGASYQRTSGPGGTMVSVDGRTSAP